MRLQEIQNPTILEYNASYPAESACTFGNLALTLEVGHYAPQANQSALLRHGKTVILATLTAAQPPKTADFRPLTVDYYERPSAVGEIPGNYQRREIRQSDHEVRISRLIDRAIRPLFDAEERREVQIVIQVLSADERSDLIGLALTAAGAVAHLSEIPFAGPVAGISLIEDRPRFNFRRNRKTFRKFNTKEKNQQRFESDSDEDLDDSLDDSLDDLDDSLDDLDDDFETQSNESSTQEEDKFKLNIAQADQSVEWIIAATPTGVVMIEGGGNAQTAETLCESFKQKTSLLEPVWACLTDLYEQVAPEKQSFVPQYSVLDNPAFEAHLEDLAHALSQQDKNKRDLLYQDLLSRLQNQVDAPADVVTLTLWSLARTYLRSEALEGRRQDGRAPHELRALRIVKSPLPQSAGSTLIGRGNTEALVSVSVGQSSEAPVQETLFRRQRNHLFCHYNFPGFTTHQIRTSRSPNRREVGHGLLIERALDPVFQIQHRGRCIRLVSDILSSDGSSSTSSICAASIALAEAGYPLTSPVVGLSVGLISEDDEGALLVDITGDEDFYGDMDFKIIGCRDGITALQLDNKLGALPWEVIEKALHVGVKGHESLLDEMAEYLEEYEPAAQRFVEKVEIAAERVGRVIGKRGQNLKALRAELHVNVDINEENIAFISGTDEVQVKAAAERIRSVGQPLHIGDEFEAHIDNVKEFGAFVTFNLHTGLVHISELHEDGGDATDHVEIGQMLKVKLVGVDRKGRLKLSHLATQY